MHSPRSDMLPILELLAIFFAGTTFAFPHAVTSAVDTSPSLSYYMNELRTPSCPGHHHLPTIIARNTTTIGLQPQVQSDVIQHEEPVFADGTQPDTTTPFSSLPPQAPAKSATLSFPPEGLSTYRPTSLRSRISAARTTLLGTWPGTKKSFRTSLPMWLALGGSSSSSTGYGAHYWDELDELAASALRLGSTSLHVAAAMFGLFLFGTIMCTL